MRASFTPGNGQQNREKIVKYGYIFEKKNVLSKILKVDSPVPCVFFLSSFPFFFIFLLLLDGLLLFIYLIFETWSCHVV